MGRGGRVLVHCMAGAQRSSPSSESSSTTSAAGAACFLVARRCATPDEAVRHIKRVRPAAFFFGIVNFQRAIDRAVELRSF